MKFCKFYLQYNKLKYSGLYLPKEMQYLYTENYQTTFTKIKEDLSKWQDIHDHELEYLVLLWQYYPN